MFFPMCAIVPLVTDNYRSATAVNENVIPAILSVSL